MTVQAKQVALDEVPWIVVWWLGHVVICGISVPTDYVWCKRFQLLCYLLDALIDKRDFGAVCRPHRVLWVSSRWLRLISCRLGRWYVALCVRCQLFKGISDFLSRSRRCSVACNYTRYFALVKGNRVICRVSNLKWANSLRQKFRSSLVCHLLGCSFQRQRCIDAYIVTWVTCWKNVYWMIEVLFVSHLSHLERLIKFCRHERKSM